MGLDMADHIEPDYISREEFLESEIAKLEYHTQTSQGCRNADPDDFITDALSEGELTPELRRQVLWVVATYQDIIDWNLQAGFATDRGYASVLADLCERVKALGCAVPDTIVVRDDGLT